MTLSLRTTALAWMTGLLTGVGLLAVSIAYAYVHHEANEFLDGQLRQIALNVGTGRTSASAPPTGLEPEDQFAVAIWDAHGALVYKTVEGDALPRQRQGGFADLEAEGRRWRVYALPDNNQFVQVAQRTDVREEIIESAAIGVAAPIALVIPLSWIVVSWAMGRTLRRLTELEVEIAERSALAKEPIPLDGVPREVAPLVVSMNGLIERLRGAVENQKRFLADAAHELRTPLAAMQIQVDNLAIGAAPPAGGLASIAAGVKRASALVNQLLRLARLDDHISIGPLRADIGALLIECVEDMAPIAGQKEVDIGVDLRTTFIGEVSEIDVRTLLSVLIDNAIRYTPPGGAVDVSLSRRRDRAIVEIVDTGLGLPKGQESRIFDRFFRGFPAQSEGSGLGLAIARRVAERNAFDLTVENRGDGCAGVCARVVMRTAETDAGLIRS
jgi:two-component system OmpR family sensor kinase